MLIHSGIEFTVQQEAIQLRIRKLHDDIMHLMIQIKKAVRTQIHVEVVFYMV